MFPGGQTIVSFNGHSENRRRQFVVEKIVEVVWMDPEQLRTLPREKGPEPSWRTPEQVAVRLFDEPCKVPQVSSHHQMRA